MPDQQEPVRQSALFLFLYALAAAGGAVAYVPFLTILLPLRVTEFAGSDALAILSYTAFAGAIAASIANIGFGWLSDVTQTRRPWIATGLLLSCMLLSLVPYATGPISLIALIICWQIALNMMLGPLSAWAGDVVPDEQKGLLGGLLAFAPALGALSGAFVTLQGLASADGRLYWVSALVLVMVAPLLLFGRPKLMPHLLVDPDSDDRSTLDTALAIIAVRRMWLARLLVQIAEASLFAFLLMWFRSLDPGFAENSTAIVFAFVLSIAVVFAIAVGRWSDRNGRPILPLALCSAIAAAGLGIMAIAKSLPIAIGGYITFGIASSIFLALHSSQTLRVLPKAAMRGRDMGIFNLTNTVPSLIMPGLTLALVPRYGFGLLFLLLAVLAVAASLLLFRVPDRSKEESKQF
ncbi:MAG TPA: MFS transporter [Sphingorhabdus sp.]|nr:MFS transporter [Sphingorhabdus sp.]